MRRLWEAAGTTAVLSGCSAPVDACAGEAPQHGCVRHRRLVDHEQQRLQGPRLDLGAVFNVVNEQVTIVTTGATDESRATRIDGRLGSHKRSPG